jgi:hypothetical protein
MFTFTSVLNAYNSEAILKHQKVRNIISMFCKLCSFAYKFQLFIVKLGELNVALICCSPVCHFAALFTLLLCVQFAAYMHKREPCCTVCPATLNGNVRGRN